MNSYPSYLREQHRLACLRPAAVAARGPVEHRPRLADLLPDVPADYRGDVVLATVKVDDRGRLALTVAVAELGWTSGTPLVAVAAGDHVVVRIGDDDAGDRVALAGRQSRLQLPRHLRRWFGFDGGIRIVVRVDVDADEVQLVRQDIYDAAWCRTQRSDRMEHVS